MNLTIDRYQNVNAVIDICYQLPMQQQKDIKCFINKQIRNKIEKQKILKQFMILFKLCMKINSKKFKFFSKKKL